MSPLAARADQLPSLLANSLAPVYLLAGSEPLLMQESRDLIIQAAQQQGFTERNVHEVRKGFDWDLLAEDSAANFDDRLSQRQSLAVASGLEEIINALIELFCATEFVAALRIHRCHPLDVGDSESCIRDAIMIRTIHGGAQLDDFAPGRQGRIEILRRGHFLPFPGCDVKQTVGTEGQAVAEVSFAGNLRFLRPDRLDGVQAKALGGADEPGAFDHGAAGGTTVAAFHARNIKPSGLGKVRMQNNVA